MNTKQALPPCAIDALDFAKSMAAEYARRGGNPSVLFAAFAGLVSSQDMRVAARCLEALDENIMTNGGK